MAFHASFLAAAAACNSKQLADRPLPFTNTIPSANLVGGLSTSFRLTNSTRKAAVLIKTSCSRQQHVDTLRPGVNHSPDVFVDYFASKPTDDSKFRSYCMETDQLKEKVKNMFLSSSRDPMEKIQFFYLLWRLGVSYHFEAEIEEELSEIFHAHPHLLTANDYDLYTTATAFHTFRHYGFKASCDAFNKFRDNAGKFKESLLKDIKGILSLYEASFLSFHGENILDEARTFTKAHLRRLVGDDDDGGHTSILDPHIRNHIVDALKLPLHRGIPRLNAREYISFYQNEENRNKTLLDFAKIDYNGVQLIYQQELCDLQRWWSGKSATMEDIPFGRSRLLGVYFWYMAMHFEPHHALSRLFATKLVVLLCYVDDIFDSYGTQEERRLFMEPTERWDYDAELPNVYIEKIFRGFLGVFREMENLPEMKPFRANYAREAFKRLVRSYYVESEWLEGESYMPSLEEYLSINNGVVTCGVPLMLSIVLMLEKGDVEEFEWLVSNSRTFRAGCLIVRVEDDIADNHKEKPHVPSSVHCYMKQHGVSEEEAFEGLAKMIEVSWKDLNEGLMRPDEVSRRLLNLLVNCVRGGEETWENCLDRCNYAERMKDKLAQVFIIEIP